MNTLKKCTEEIRQLFLAPKTFFQKQTKKAKIKPVILLYFILQTVSAIFNLVNFFILTLYINNVNIASLNLNEIFISSIISIIVGTLVSLVGSFILYSYLKIFKAKGNFLNTYQIFVYSSVPSLLLGWVPILSILAMFYGIYLLIVGTEIMHKLSRRKSLVAYLLLLAVIIAYGVLRSLTG